MGANQRQTCRIRRVGARKPFSNVFFKISYLNDVDFGLSEAEKSNIFLDRTL